MLLLASLAACQPKPQGPASDPTVEATPPVVRVEPVVRETAPPQPKPDPLRLAVLVSDDAPEYDTVHAALVQIAGADHVTSFPLHGKANAARQAVAALRQQGHTNIVSIGLLAAMSARSVEDANAVFCQVFNHGEHELLGAKMRGIEAVPRLDEAVATWKKLNPKLARIGVITGVGHDDFVRRSAVALQKFGVELRHQVTGSDKETMVTFTRMLSEVDGYWLLPDNRVLSRNVLRELMITARRAGIGVLVHDASLLEMGGLISATSRPSEIAKAAYDLLLSARARGEFATTRMQPLRQSTVRVHADLAKQLGYRVDAIPTELWAR